MTASIVSVFEDESNPNLLRITRIDGHGPNDYDDLLLSKSEARIAARAITTLLDAQEAFEARKLRVVEETDHEISDDS